MRLTCPGCGLLASAEAWANDGAARELLGTVAALPGRLPGLTLPYLALFRPAKSALSWQRANKLALELARLVGTGYVQPHGRVARPCPPELWAEAIEQMLARRDQIRRPLKNHNYLRQVAWPLADGRDAQVERRREEERQRRARSIAELPEEVQAEIKRITGG